MAAIGDLVFSRGQIKAKLTRFKTYFDSIDRNDLNDQVISRLSIRIQSFEPILQDFNDVQTQIESLINNNTDPQFQIDTANNNKERTEFEDSYFDYLADAKTVCENYFKKNINPFQSNNQLDLSVSSDHNPEDVEVEGSVAGLRSVIHLKKRIELPKITLPSFNGKPGTWTEFKDAFVALVDSDETLSNYEKFYYLKMSCKDEAADIIQAIPVTDDNYKVGWQALIDNYESKAQLIHDHIQAILNIPTITKESHQDLKSLYVDINKHLRSLNNLGEKTDSWDRIIIQIVSNKFDSVTFKEWQSYKWENELPALKDLNNFLKDRIKILSKLESKKSSQRQNIEIQQYNSKKRHSNSFVTSSKKMNCVYCKKPDHSIYSCRDFLTLSVNSRIAEIKKLKLCLNCLKSNHNSWNCNVQKCKKCNKPHNTLLHLDFSNSHNSKQSVNSEFDNFNKEATSVSTSYEPSAPPLNTEFSGFSTNKSFETPSQVILSTAIVHIVDNKNNIHNCRVLLDNGSQSNFITEKFCKKLKLKPNKVNFAVKGVGEILENISYQVKVKLQSRYNNFQSNIDCLVLPSITENLPVKSFDKMSLDIPNHLKLADPNFNTSREIDLLLGSSIFWSLICVGQIKLGPYLPILQKTHLGWIVAGNIYDVSDNQFISCLCVCKRYNSNDTLNNQISKFWEVENIPQQSHPLSAEDQYCEKYFNDTTCTDATGRLIVKIPFNTLKNYLGDTFEMAQKRFFSLEKKLNSDHQLKLEYSKFIQEYESLGHMTKISSQNINNECGFHFYLPHHAVFKSTSLTTKLRVVFDGSAKSDTGISLNDAQFTGPKLQNDLLDILLRFRIYNFVITGDVSKMYRQILIHKTERSFQRILWRENSSDNLDIFELNTVTYGTASAPYLSVKCLKKLASDNCEKYPLSSKIIHNDFYIDDLITGSNSKDELLKIQKEVSLILNSAGFQLRKWLSNDLNLLQAIDSYKDLDCNVLQVGEDEGNKTLGLLWKPVSDTINYSVSDTLDNNQTTKRTILSTICQIFDPLGLLGPILIKSKLLIQEMWILNISWDETIPQDLHYKWNQFKKELILIKNIKIPRQSLFSLSIRIEMHGFADSSEFAYGACIYIRCVLSDRLVSNLLCAKSRVAPVRQISLPRLELCAALLLAQLVRKVNDALRIAFDKLYYWSDSTITLSWIKGDSRKWKTFVANRVGEIQSLSNTQDWHHIKSAENPADLLSRGVSVDYLLGSELWWHGPKFLRSHNSTWKLDSDFSEPTELPDVRLSHVALIYKKWDVLDKYCSLLKLQRVVAFVYRFINNSKLPLHNRVLTRNLTLSELNHSLFLIIKLTQTECFPSDYNNLLNNKPIDTKSNILSLNPFMDENQLIRVGGRIKNANLNYDKKHPLLLPQKHNVTKLIFKHFHEKMLHCGAQALLYAVREKYWVISGRNLAKNTIRCCLTCFKVKPQSSGYIMGNLPAYRINQCFPFENVGVDYGGPFLLKDRMTRGAKIMKCYVCLFICMATRAVHLELVSNLSTDSFMATLKRFISRRGKPKNIFSDNGLNFVGTNNELHKIYSFLEFNSNSIEDQLGKDLIKWHFIPANSPTFGGLWEAGIKITKYHLKRVIGLNKFDFEQFYTILTQIEAVLNSRPISPLSSDPEDLLPLTPGHFLIGRPLCALPEHDYTEIATNRLTKFKHIQQIIQHFWCRWYKEYISGLQSRQKWKYPVTNVIKIGTLVIIKEDNLPPLKWKLGRIHQLHPGEDNIVRVVSVKTEGGILKRSINKICPLPVESEYFQGGRHVESNSVPTTALSCDKNCLPLRHGFKLNVNQSDEEAQDDTKSELAALAKTRRVDTKNLDRDANVCT